MEEQMRMFEEEEAPGEVFEVPNLEPDCPAPRLAQMVAVQTAMLEAMAIAMIKSGVVTEDDLNEALGAVVAESPRIGEVIHRMQIERIFKEVMNS